MKGFAYLENVTTLEIEEESCFGCGMCAEVCPHRVFIISVGKSRIIERDACIECGACALNCPAGALSVNAGVGCASAIIREFLDRFRPSPKGGGGCC